MGRLSEFYYSSSLRTIIHLLSLRPASAVHRRHPLPRRSNERPFVDCHVIPGDSRCLTGSALPSGSFLIGPTPSRPTPILSIGPTSRPYDVGVAGNRASTPRWPAYRMPPDTSYLRESRGPSESWRTWTGRGYGARMHASAANDASVIGGTGLTCVICLAGRGHWVDR